MSDSEQCLNIETESNSTEFRFWSTFHVNWGKLWQDRTSKKLDEFWAMFEPTTTLPDFTYGQLFIWIGANNDQMTFWRLDEWLWAMFESTPTWPEFTFGQLFIWFGPQIMTRYDFLEARRWVILSNVRPETNFLDVSSGLQYAKEE